MPVPQQAVVLCGGLGTRLGALTKQTPKPLLLIRNRPFLDVLLGEIGRYGFNRVPLLAGFEGGQVVNFARTTPMGHRFGLDIIVVIEPRQLGTGGALRFARDALDDSFLLLNGDTWFDINPLLLCRLAEERPDSLATLALRRSEDVGRYGVPELDNLGRIRSFADRPSTSSLTLINGGVYFIHREVASNSKDLRSSSIVTAC